YDGRCPHTVKWLYVGNNVDKDDKALQTSQSGCSASVTFQSSHFIVTSNSDLLKCEVTDGDKVQLFPFRLQPSGDDTTATKPRPEPTTTTTTDSSMKRGTITTASPISDDSANLEGLLRFIIVSVGLAALIIIMVAVSMWTRTKGRKTQMDENMVSFYSKETKQRNGQIT
ncbi:uncharacterized protein LOC104934980, partial [Larimichthys crocea]|uniref:uncharacterized protein LOC104934980 n=1 Tax=Larimichthys crocea TaxID=215358 RepID=UPI000F5F1B57